MKAKISVRPRCPLKKHINHELISHSLIVRYDNEIIVKATTKQIEIFPENYPFKQAKFCHVLTYYLSMIKHLAKVHIKNGEYVYSDCGNKEVRFQENKIFL